MSPFAQLELELAPQGRGTNVVPRVSEAPADDMPDVPDATTRQRNLILLQQTIQRAKKWPRTPDLDVRREKPSGWLLPLLIGIDNVLWGRWDYWIRARVAGRLPDEPIPPITFTSSDSPARKMLEATLDCIPRSGGWRGWSHWQYLDYLLDWLLYGFGARPTAPREPEDGAFSRVYQVFCLEALLAWPHDYLGDLMAENHHGRHLGFYPTPHDVCEMMTRMQMGDEDMRAKSVCDPAVGTGRMLLHASNHSMRLFGMDINETCVKACHVNLWLYAPWGARPLSFLEGKETA